jgi:hypothetical protein
MCFNLIKNPIIFNYSISNSNLKLVSNFKDHEIVYDSKLNFSYHTEFIKNKSIKQSVLVFIKRSCNDFCKPFPLKILYCSSVRSNLDYCPLIWINNMSKQNDNIEAVQNNFLQFMSSKCNLHRPPHSSYDNILNNLNLIPLKTRHSQLILKCFHKLISCLIDCPDLLYLIKFKINSFNTRNPEFFYPIHSDRNYILNSPANQLMIAENNYTFNFN